jgi:hypothetical protein
MKILFEGRNEITGISRFGLFPSAAENRFEVETSRGKPFVAPRIDILTITDRAHSIQPEEVTIKGADSTSKAARGVIAIAYSEAGGSAEHLAREVSYFREIN